MVVSSENIFLVVIGLIWIIGAIFQDLRRREVDNIWNFSLIPIALAYRASISIFSGNYWFIINGLIGLLIFLILGNLFYYSRMFAGGDAKLVIALGSVLPLSFSWIVNFQLFGLFILLFLLGGSVYVFIWSVALVFINYNKFRKEFIKQFIIYKNLFLISLIIALTWLAVSFILINKGIGYEFFYFSLIIVLFPILFVYSKSVEESCMVRKVNPKFLTEGDWLYEDLYIKGKKIEKNWEGLSKEEIRLINKKYKRKVAVKYGVPFTPSFLIGFVGMLYFVDKLVVF